MSEQAWQDIRTAPRDGTAVALWDDNQHVAYVGHFGRLSMSGRLSPCWQSRGEIAHPTHWTALPLPPPSGAKR